MKTAWAVWNSQLDLAIAIFLTQEAAIAYAAGFPQCKVYPWTVPGDIFDPE